MDRKSFERLAAKARPMIVGSVTPIVGDDDAAQDVAQDTLLKLWSLGDRLDAYSNPLGLSLRIARNLAIDHLRRHRPEASLAQAHCVADDDEADRGLQREERSRELDTVLASLPDTMATIIRMRHVEEMEISDIARLTGSTEGAVRVALSRARHRVKEIFLKNQMI